MKTFRSNNPSTNLKNFTTYVHNTQISNSSIVLTPLLIIKSSKLCKTGYFRFELIWGSTGNCGSVLMGPVGKLAISTSLCRNIEFCCFTIRIDSSLLGPRVWLKGPRFRLKSGSSGAKTDSSAEEISSAASIACRS